MKDYSVLLSCGEANMVIIHDAFDKGYQQGYADALRKNAVEENDKAYQQGLEDAWEAVSKIFGSDGLTIYEVGEIFGTVVYGEILERYSASEVMAKIKEYEEQQKKFAVGDEVYSDAFDDKGIITHITADKVSCVCIICNGSTMMKVGTDGLHKTGRHFSQIAEVLEKIRGEE